MSYARIAAVKKWSRARLPLPLPRRKRVRECAGVRVRLDKFSLGSIRIDGVTRDYDVVIDGGEIRKSGKSLDNIHRGVACSGP
jgi:hypothetical protein